MNEKLKPLTWNELADLHDKHVVTGRRAKTLPMDVIAAWAEIRSDLFVTDKDGCICKKI